MKFPEKSTQLAKRILLGSVFSITFSIVLSQEISPRHFQNGIIDQGGLIRGDTTDKVLFLVFTGGEFNDGKNKIPRTLKSISVKAHFFFTGEYYRNHKNRRSIRKLINGGHYLGPHSDQHLLYAAWENRDSLLVTQTEFEEDLLKNYLEMKSHGILKEQSRVFMPPFEWYNQTVSDWAHEMGIQLVNYTPGTRSNADYTTPDMGRRYLDSETIFQNIINYEASHSCGLNGYILLLHIGTDPKRKDKFYNRLDELILALKSRGYSFSLLTDP